MFSHRDVSDAKRRYEQELLRKGNVRGVGIGYKITAGRATNELSVVVLVTRKIHSVSALSSYDMVPRTLEGIRTDVLETGVIRIPPTPVTPIRQSPVRPALGGCSIGHQRVTAGTFGCLVRRGYETFILSNNHVLADENRGVKGDAILQPGPADGGRFPDHKIAELEAFIPLYFTRTNRVDAALAKPVSMADVTDDIIEIGSPTGVVSADLGMSVRKSGRTTGVTQGYITIMDATVNVEYSGGRIARFENQLIVVSSEFSRGGDSGSVVLIDDGTRRVCGLLFAGSEYVTVINRIEDVFSSLNIRI